MPAECSAAAMQFARLDGRDVVADFGGGVMTSDAGALLLGATDRAIGLVDRFAACFSDGRAAGRVVHDVATLVGQRVFGIALGYEDLIDHDALRHDPVLGVGLGRLEARRAGCAPLAGKSTLNRLEHAPSGAHRYRRIGHEPEAIETLFVDLFLDAHGQAPERLILDLDATDDPLHGHQEGRFFHGYYDCYCYLPLYIFCGDHLLAAKLRRADIDASAGAAEEVARIVARIRARWPAVEIVLRADSGFAREALMAWCEENGVDYVFGLARNSRLTDRLQPALDLAEARQDCLARQVAHEPDKESVPRRRAPSFREFVEGEWKDAHFARYKPSTKKGHRSLLARQLLPKFGSIPLDRIAPTRVRRWFDAYSRTAPVNANCGLDVLRQIMNFAIARGHADANPAAGIKPNRRPELTRFLSREEIARLHRALDGQTGRGNRQQADVIRLLLLTGCRRGEIVRLRWSEVQGDVLMLADSKTGPRKVPLNSQARRILERPPRGESPFVFPSLRDPSRPRHPDLNLWYRVRKEAGIEDVRLHDLRHTVASHAVMNGVPVPVVSRLLGHSNVRMTLRYAHLGTEKSNAPPKGWAGPSQTSWIVVRPERATDSMYSSSLRGDVLFFF